MDPLLRAKLERTADAPGQQGPSPAVVFEAREATVRYGDQDVVDRVSFRIRGGEFVGLVGPNGAGKSTVLRALLGLVPLHRGGVRVFGEAPQRFRDWPRVGYVPQKPLPADARFFPATVQETVLLGRAPRRGLFRRFTPRDRARAAEALRVVGMQEQAGARLAELSGGQQQRVFLAKALAADPEVLVLDEPTTGVDPAARQAFYELLDCLNHDDGLTVLLVSHDMQAVMQSAHRILALHRRLVFDGPPAELEKAGGLAAVYGVPVTHEHGGHPHAAWP